MSGKVALLVGGAVGYVLGAKAGRQRYDQIKDRTQALWSDPAVQDTVARARSQAQQKVKAVTGSRPGASGDESGE